MGRYALNQSKYLQKDELNQLETFLKSMLQRENPRDALILMIGLKTGARASEILNLRIQDYNRAEKTLFFRGLKGSRDREIPVSNQIAYPLDRVLKRPRLGDRIFEISYSRLYQIWDLYRPVKKKFHSLRHTFAVEAYLKTKDIKLIQVALGHANITNTLIYIDYLYSKNELKRLIT